MNVSFAASLRWIRPFASRPTVTSVDLRLTPEERVAVVRAEVERGARYLVFREREREGRVVVERGARYVREL